MFLFIAATFTEAFLILNFNTSHVLIHQIPYLNATLLYGFQYISCSYSSTVKCVAVVWMQGFQYISCSYSSAEHVKDVERLTGYFNTSHVLIHPDIAEYCASAISFQYISCSYSSVWDGEGEAPDKFQYISCSYSSTKANADAFKTKLFQYISCSYSSLDAAGRCPAKKFQYISCSYSSLSGIDGSASGYHFNTSHVLIHQAIGGAVGGVKNDFNTSHVLIHLLCLQRRRTTIRISIHLMFLFIGNGRTGRGSETSISIHLMFLFIRDRVGNTVNNV